ncbi:uncharacterized protein [Eucyclogobius newberryi]|uniref:uncharacterized protein n=1 Tax=Eucyclogobius newberryi TaxID=166745 RepID=UPI003B5A70C5
MKFLVALALISVCNANVVEYKTDLDLVRDMFWEYAAWMAPYTEQSLKQIQNSKLGREVNTKLSQRADIVNKYSDALESYEPALCHELLIHITDDAEELKSQLEFTLSKVSAHLRPKVEQLVADIQTKLDALVRDADFLIEAMVDPKTLQTVLMPKSQDLTTTMASLLALIGKRYGKKIELMSNDITVELMEMVDDYGLELSSRMREVLLETLVTSTEELKAKLEANAQDVKAQIAVLWEAFTQKTTK